MDYYTKESVSLGTALTSREVALDHVSIYNSKSILGNYSKVCLLTIVGDDVTPRIFCQSYHSTLPRSDNHKKPVPPDCIDGVPGFSLLTPISECLVVAKNKIG